MKRRLGDRGVDDPLLAEVGQQPVEGVEHAAVAGDVLADDERRLVLAP